MTIELAQITGKSDKHIHWFSQSTGIHHEVVEPWNKLCYAAKKQGLNLSIASGFRSFDRQLSIWNRKFTGQLTIKDIDNIIIDIKGLEEAEIIKAILTFSALPGASRHHWGTDLDFYDNSALSNGQTLQLEAWEYQNKGPFAEITHWLKQNAQEYGFYFPYDKYRGGIAAEPWHLSYFPLAEKFEKELTITTLSNCLKHIDLKGKKQVIEQIESILTQYVFNIGRYHHG